MKRAIFLIWWFFCHSVSSMEWNTQRLENHMGPLKNFGRENVTPSDLFWDLSDTDINLDLNFDEILSKRAKKLITPSTIDNACKFIEDNDLNPNLANERGWTITMLALQMNRPDIVMRMIQDPRFDPNIIGRHGVSVGMLVARHFHSMEDIEKFLLNTEVDFLLEDSFGLNFVMYLSLYQNNIFPTIKKFPKLQASLAAVSSLWSGLSPLHIILLKKKIDRKKIDLKDVKEISPINVEDLINLLNFVEKRAKDMNINLAFNINKINKINWRDLQKNGKDINNIDFIEYLDIVGRQDFKCSVINSFSAITPYDFTKGVEKKFFLLDSFLEPHLEFCHENVAKDTDAENCCSICLEESEDSLLYKNPCGQHPNDETNDEKENGKNKICIFCVSDIALRTETNSLLEGVP